MERAGNVSNSLHVSSQGRMKMAHEVDGYELKYNGRRSWMAQLSQGGIVIEPRIPVTWATDWQKGGLLRVWFRDRAEMLKHNDSKTPFIVAVATRARSDNPNIERFEKFNAIFRVTPTGELLSENSIQTRILDRLSDRKT